MGAATVAMTTGDKLPENVKLAIADCSYSSVWEEFKLHLRKILHLPAFPVLYAGSLMAKIFAEYSFKEASVSVCSSASSLVTKTSISEIIITPPKKS